MYRAVYSMIKFPTNDLLNVFSNLSEESKQQSSELSEQLKLSNQDNAAIKLEVEDLRKRLEISDLMLQQVSPNGPILCIVNYVLVGFQLFSSGVSWKNVYIFMIRALFMSSSQVELIR